MDTVARFTEYDSTLCIVLMVHYQHFYCAEWWVLECCPVLKHDEPTPVPSPPGEVQAISGGAPPGVPCHLGLPRHHHWQRPTKVLLYRDNLIEALVWKPFLGIHKIWICVDFLNISKMFSSRLDMKMEEFETELPAAAAHPQVTITCHWPWLLNTMLNVLTFHPYICAFERCRSCGNFHIY